jgi:hypothetical protein
MTEIISELPDFQETYDLYEDRRPDVPEEDVLQEKLEFQDIESAQAKMNGFAAECAKEFLKINENSYESETFGSGDFKRTNMKFAEQMLDSSIPLRLIAYKYFVEDKGVKSERIRFCLDKGSEDKLVAVIQGIDQGDKGFDINHRFVGPQYRRKQGVGTMVINCAESFAKSLATNKQKKVDLFADTAQLDVIYWFWKNGYRPEEKEDWERLNMIVNGDESLCLDGRLYVFDKNITGDDRYEKDRSGQVIKENGVKSIDPTKAFQLRMVKTFKPNLSAEIEEIRSGMKDVLGGV